MQKHRHEVISRLLALLGIPLPTVGRLADVFALTPTPGLEALAGAIDTMRDRLERKADIQADTLRRALGKECAETDALRKTVDVNHRVIHGLNVSLTEYNARIQALEANLDREREDHAETKRAKDFYSRRVYTLSEEVEEAEKTLDQIRNLL